MDRRIAFQCAQRIFVNQLGVEKQTTDHRALAIIYAAARQEPQQLLAFVLGKIGIDVGSDQVGTM